MDTKVIQNGNNILTKEEVQSFKQLMRDLYEIELTDEEALEQGTRLIMLIELVCKLNTKKDSVNDVEKVVKSD